MAELESGKPVSLEELMVTTLAMTDMLTKLLIEGRHHGRGVQKKLLEERAAYPANFKSDSAIGKERPGVTPAKDHPIRARLQRHWFC
jgi:hypothetical protein